MGFWGLGFRSVGLRDFGVGFRISLTMVGWGTSELGCQHSWTSCTFWRSGTRIAAFSSRAVKVPNGLALGRAFSWNWPSTRERNMVGTKKIKKKRSHTLCQLQLRLRKFLRHALHFRRSDGHLETKTRKVKHTNLHLSQPPNQILKPQTC